MSNTSIWALRDYVGSRSKERDLFNRLAFQEKKRWLQKTCLVKSSDKCSVAKC